MEEDPLAASDSGEWERLNAYVDGEMPEAERSRLRERARTDPLFAIQVAGLRRLKAEIKAAGGRSKAPRTPVVPLAAILAVLIAGAIWYGRPATEPRTMSQTSIVSDFSAALGEVRRAGDAAAPLSPQVPILDLTEAGFKLVSSIASSIGGAPLLVYEGSHGCRVGVTAAVLPVGEIESAGVTAKTWAAAGQTFTLVTRGMDPDRSRQLATALELMTGGGTADRIVVALRSSGVGRSCLG